jgi:glycosyltransferase involved in cell wall biosynthesis
MKVYLIDIIGIHSGAFYYNRAFRDVLRHKFRNVEIISNYKESDGTGKKLLMNYYSGNPLTKFIKLLISLFRFFFFVLFNRKNCYIFMAYGNPYEIMFLVPLLVARKKIIDVHEVVSLINANRSNAWLRSIYIRLTYHRIADAVIIHSKRSSDLLNDFGYNRFRIEIPHFSYHGSDSVDNQEIPDDVHRLISGSGINILFFGFMRISKGIDITAKIISEARNFDPGNRLNFIIAGNDPDKLFLQSLKKYNIDGKSPVSLLLRFITDQELHFLFSKCDFVFLPYLEISQSGVMEMAIRFRKPVITSAIQYFREMLDMFPSFGFASSGNDPEEYIKLFKIIIEQHNNLQEGTFYTDSDLAKFNAFKDPEHFLEEMEKTLSSGN